MLSPSGTLGRLPFIAGVMVVNTIAMLVAGASFLFHPVGAGHIAVIVVMAAIAWVWFVLHARRLADAGRTRGSAALVALALFGAFVLAHAVVAGVWANPQVQHEGFRTGGVMGAAPVESSVLVNLIGREIVGLMGVAGAIVVSGLAMAGAGFVAAAGAVYSFFVMLKGSRGNPKLPRLPGSSFATAGRLAGATIPGPSDDRRPGDHRGERREAQSHAWRRRDDDHRQAWRWDARDLFARVSDKGWSSKKWAKRWKKRRDRDDD